MKSMNDSEKKNLSTEDLEKVAGGGIGLGSKLPCGLPRGRKFYAAGL